MYGGVKYAHKRPAKSSSTTVIRSGWVNDRWVKDIVLDTGAAKTMIRGDLVTEEDMVGSSIIVKCAHGDGRLPSRASENCSRGGDIYA